MKSARSHTYTEAQETIGPESPANQSSMNSEHTLPQQLVKLPALRSSISRKKKKKKKREKDFSLFSFLPGFPIIDQNSLPLGYLLTLSSLLNFHIIRIPPTSCVHLSHVTIAINMTISSLYSPKRRCIPIFPHIHI